MSTHTFQIELPSGLRHHAIEWRGDGPLKGTVLLAHGFLDQGFSWRMVAESLAEQGFRALAWDWRGHGRTEWCGPGGYYHFFDYIRDLDALVVALQGDESPLEDALEPTFHLVGHSMGGTVCSMYAGLRPERIQTLCLVEGLGPPSGLLAKGATKAKTWLDSLERYAARRVRTMTIEEVIVRLRLGPTDEGPMTHAMARFLAECATRPQSDGENSLRIWRFDPLHRTTSPTVFTRESFCSFLERIEAPTLLVAGEKGFRLPDEQERVARINRHSKVEFPGIGHMIHWHAPQALADELLKHIVSFAKSPTVD